MVKSVYKKNLYMVKKFLSKKHRLIKQTQIVNSMFRERETANYRPGRLSDHTTDHSYWNNIVNRRQFV